MITIAVILLLLFLGVVQIYRPRFGSSVPARIVIEARQFKGKEPYRTSVTKQNGCSSVIDSFEHGTLAMPCMCKAYARFAIHYGNGTVDHVDLLSGHSGPEYFQIRRGLWHYRLSRAEFGRTIREASVDESKLFAYEDLLYSEDTKAIKNQAEQAAPSDGDKPSN